MKTGEEAECDACGRSAVIDTPVMDMFGHRVAYGPDGPEDQFIELQDGELRCYDCNVEYLDGVALEGGGE